MSQDCLSDVGKNHDVVFYHEHKTALDNNNKQYCTLELILKKWKSESTHLRIWIASFSASNIDLASRMASCLLHKST